MKLPTITIPNALKAYMPKVNLGSLLMFSMGTVMFGMSFVAETQTLGVIVAVTAGALISWALFDATVLRFWKSMATRWQNAAENAVELLEAVEDQSIEVSLGHDQIAELSQALQDYLNKYEAGEISKNSGVTVTLGKGKVDDHADS